MSLTIQNQGQPEKPEMNQSATSKEPPGRT